MSQALYRKWRPARFPEIVGQEHVTRTLQNAVAADRLGHAYLFSGPRGTGKTTTARLLAKAANCQHEDLAQRPCNQCPPCRAIYEGRFLDLIEIDAASNTGVDDIRDLREKINFSPSEGRFKIYIIDEVHMLSTAAFNALLKTLEEPPPHAIFVLATTEEHKVPLTIKSRCQQFNFRLLTTKEILGRLDWLTKQEAVEVEGSALRMIAIHGSGSLRDAESLLDQLIAAPGDTITLERAQRILGTASDAAVSALTDAWIEGNGPVGLGLIHEALGSGADARQFARQMVAYLRHLLLVQTAGRDLNLDLTDEQFQNLTQQARKIDRQFLIEAIRRFNEAATISSASMQPQLPLELAFVQLLPSSPTPSRQPSQARTPTLAEIDTVRQGPADDDSSNRGGEMQAEVEAEPKVSPDSAVLEKTRAPSSKAAAKQQKSATKDTGAGLPSLTIEQVSGHWPQVREYVSHQDRNLTALLASCKPLAVEGSSIVLGFDFPILRDKFERRPEAKEIVGEALSQLLNLECGIKTVVTEQYMIPSNDETIDPAEIKALAEELGGGIRKSDG